MLLNLSNHPLNECEPTQLAAASTFGELIDIPFPYIKPSWNEKQVQEMGTQYANRCLSLMGGDYDGSALHIMGEMTFCYYVISKLREAGIKCIASTTKREVSMDSSLKLTSSVL